MKHIIFFVSVLALIGCQEANQIDEPNSLTTPETFVDLSQRDKPDPVVSGGWQSVLISVPDMEEFARLFIQIGNYETVDKDDQNWILRAPGTEDGYIHLWKNLNEAAIPARPIDATAWDTGCYWSVMMRAKNIPSIIEDAQALGWEPYTEMAYLEFGPSKLNIVVLRHQITGAQIQLYERLSTPLPEVFPEFERISRPFNIMQMVENRDEAYDFFQQKLGFETFYYGKPTVSAQPEVMPLGIPKELTTKVPYKAAIVYPEKGMEWGRFEMIEIDGEEFGLKGRDVSNRCNSLNWGVLQVKYFLPESISVKEFTKQNESQFGITVRENVDWDNESPLIAMSPDGAQIVFEAQE